MKITKCELEGLLIIELDIFSDNRGLFMERFSEKKFAESGLPKLFRQDNHSRSNPGVVRGLHYQAIPPQGKLVGCINGRIWDVAVDIRPESNTYGKYFGVELNETNGKLLWMPPGFAHGFSVLGDKPADVLYKVTEMYNPQGEKGIRWNDEEIGIKWPVDVNPILSEKDKIAPTFAEYRANPPQW